MKLLYKNNKSVSRGFSLLEIVIYMAIVGILFVGVVDLTLIVKQSQSKFSVNRRVTSDVSNALETIKYLVQGATALPADNNGVLCEDFEGAQGYNSYYLSLYYNTSSAQATLPYECRGDYNATTTAVKIYWKSLSDRGLWIDCYRGFINGNSGNCTTIQNYGDASYMLTAAKNTVIYDGGFQVSTSTSYGTSALKVSITMGIPNSDHPNYYSATTTASTTAIFRVKLADTPAPTEVVCGDGAQATGEVCDSTLTSVCSQDASYYSGGYVEDSSTCSGKYACNNSCSACLSQLACTGSCGTGGYLSGGYCYYLGAANETCTTVCSSHAGCVAGALTDTACAIMIDRGASCSSCEANSSGKYSPSWDSTTLTCYETSSAGYSCVAVPPVGYSRLCRCNS